MKQVIVNYKVKAGMETENELLVRAVYRELKEKKPAGVHYATYKLPDGVSFMHIGIYETTEAHDLFANLSSFKKFQEKVKDRCAEPPVLTPMEVIGSYHP